MSSVADLMISIGHGLSSMALAVVCYGMLQRVPLHDFYRSCLIGISFGVAAVLMMTSPIRIAEGVIVDARFVTVGLAGAFGGIPAAVASAAISGAFRVSLGGHGAAMGMVAVALAAIAGPIWGSMFLSRSKIGVFPLSAFGAVLSVHLMAIAFIPVENAVSLMLTTWIVAMPIYICSTICFGLLMNRERSHIEREDSLHRLTRTDHLTGMPNRRQFTEYAQNVLQKEKQGGNGFAILMIDIDHFKRVNDSYGHQAGDKALVAVATILMNSVGRVDLAARYGGEEFAVLLLYATPNQAMAKAEKIRDSIKALTIAVDAAHFSVTISTGIATSYAGDSSLNAILASADEALYRAKRNGRDRVEIESKLVEAVPRPELMLASAA